MLFHNPPCLCSNPGPIPCGKTTREAKFGNCSPAGAAVEARERTGKMYMLELLNSR